MLLVNADSVLRFVGEILQFAALLLAGLFAIALVARALGPRETPPESISGYETALATRMLRRYGVRWVLLCLGLAIVGNALLRVAD